jgi:thiol-disulfide isomerase/thioredoxin
VSRGPTFWIVLLAAIAASLGLYVEHRRSHPPPPSGVAVADVGDRRPDLSLTGLDGHSHRFAEWDGKLVLVNFWATWCAPCHAEMPLLSRAAARYASRGVQVIGIAEDDPGVVRAYLDATPIDYPVLFGTEHEAFPSMRFGNTRELLPYSVLIGRDGRILRRKLGTFSEPELDEWLQDTR